MSMSSAGPVVGRSPHWTGSSSRVDAPKRPSGVVYRLSCSDRIRPPRPASRDGTAAVRIYLYRCFDRDGQLIYAGITDDVERRRKEHAAEKFWWPDVARVTTMAFENRLQALWAEWAVITTCAPVYNKAAVLPPVPTALPRPDGVDPAVVPLDITANGKMRTRDHILSILIDAHPEGCTSGQIGVSLDQRNAGVTRTHRQDVLKAMKAAGEIVRSSVGSYSLTQ